MSMIKAYLHERQDEINRQAIEDMECQEFHDQLRNEFDNLIFYHSQDYQRPKPLHRVKELV